MIQNNTRSQLLLMNQNCGKNPQVIWIIKSYLSFLLQSGSQHGTLLHMIHITCTLNIYCISRRKMGMLHSNVVCTRAEFWYGGWIIALLPEWLAVDADLLENVLEKLWRALLHHMLDAEPGFQVFQKALHEAHKVFCRPDASWDGFCIPTKAAAISAECDSSRRTKLYRGAETPFNTKASVTPACQTFQSLTFLLIILCILGSISKTFPNVLY